MQVGPEILAWAADFVSTSAIFTQALMSYCASGIKYDDFWKYNKKSDMDYHSVEVDNDQNE